MNVPLTMNSFGLHQPQKGDYYIIKFKQTELNREALNFFVITLTLFRMWNAKNSFEVWTLSHFLVFLYFHVFVGV